MKSIEAGGRIHKGKLVIHAENVFKQAISDVGFASHAHLTVEFGNKRTIPQNSYLFGAIVGPIRTRLKQDGWTYSYHECYKYLENRFSKVDKVNHITGEIREEIAPLKELDTQQWDEIVMNDIRNWAEFELGIYCELPHEYFDMDPQVYDRWKRGEITKKKAIELTEELRTVNTN